MADDFPGFIEHGLPGADEMSGRSTTEGFVVADPDPGVADNILGFVKRGHLAGHEMCGRSTTGPLVVPPRELATAEDFPGFVERGLPEGEEFRSCSTDNKTTAYLSSIMTQCPDQAKSTDASLDAIGVQPQLPPIGTATCCVAGAERTALENDVLVNDHVEAWINH